MPHFQISFMYYVFPNSFQHGSLPNTRAKVIFILFIFNLDFKNMFALYYRFKQTDTRGAACSYCYIFTSTAPSNIEVLV